MGTVSGEPTDSASLAQGAKQPLAVPRRLLKLRSDAALAERFAAGDEAAFDVIYERHRPVVLAVAMGVLGTPHDAEDATQETFSALATALRNNPPADLRPWLIRVARNAAIDATRRRRHRLLTFDGEIPEIPARPAGAGQAELAVVLDGIRELPEGQRMALLMRELGGHSYAEIAELLETDQEAVKGLIARARVSLRAHREATEFSCSTAREAIAMEPDARRYDKTVRRHIRGCGSCRAYREALRGDARSIRGALPIQAGSVATGGISSGMLTAAKGSMLGYGLTQAATTCAASACAVGAIGGMVFVAPVHRLGLPPLFPAAKRVTRPHHAVVKPHVTKVHLSKPRVAQPNGSAAAKVTAPKATVSVPTHAKAHPHAVVRHHHHRSTHHTTMPLTPVTQQATATPPPSAPAQPVVSRPIAKPVRHRPGITVTRVTLPSQPEGASRSDGGSAGGITLRLGSSSQGDSSGKTTDGTEQPRTVMLPGGSTTGSSSSSGDQGGAQTSPTTGQSSSGSGDGASASSSTTGDSQTTSTTSSGTNTPSQTVTTSSGSSDASTSTTPTTDSASTGTTTIASTTTTGSSDSSATTTSG